MTATLPTVNSAAVLRLENAARSALFERSRLIRNPALPPSQALPIDDVYVRPLLSRRPSATRDASTERTFAEVDWQEAESVVRSAHRVVILGDPGSGKSTLVQRAVRDICAPHERAHGLRRTRLAIPVILRDFVASEERRPMGFLEYMAQQMRTRLLVDCGVDELTYLLAVGRVTVIFDGLDELGEITHRMAIGSDVESFCRRFELAPVVVTSRIVGYDAAALDPVLFGSVWRVAAFDDARINQFVRSWFRMIQAADGELEPDEATVERATSTFMSESDESRDIRANPLMLSLMCLLYRGSGSLPRHRTDLYERCALLMYERWDSARGLTVPSPYDGDFKKTVAHLAMWMFGDVDRRAGVTRSELEAEVLSFIRATRFRDEVVARSATRQVVEQATGRSWVLDVTGLRDAEEVYEFPHRTFMEYFTALHLVGAYPTPAQLWRALRRRIPDYDWWVVASMAVQIQARATANSADQVLARVLNDCVKPGNAPEVVESCENFVGEVLRSPVSPESIDLLVQRNAAVFTRRFSRSLNERRGDVPSGWPSIRDAGLVRALEHMSAENRLSLASSLAGRTFSWPNHEPAITRLYLLVVVELLRLHASSDALRTRLAAREEELRIHSGSWDELRTRFAKVDAHLRRGLISSSEHLDELIEVAARSLLPASD